ncbi:MAG: efflux RND transporter permease subunit, partial [Planctomycetota bacterium]
MNLPEFSVRRGVTTLMIFFAGLLVGGFCLVQTPIDLFPEMDIPMITVITPYKGAGPEDIEEKITQVLERALSTVEDVDHVYSTSREGASVVRLSFNWQTDLDDRANDVRDAIDQVERQLPDEAEDSRIYKFDVSQFPILVFGVRASESYPDLEDILEDRVANRLERISGVASAQILVPLNRQVNVDLDRERLASVGLTPADVVRAIARENRQISAGSIETGEIDYLPRVPGEFESVEPMNDIVLAARGGNIVRIRDVGQVSDGFEEVERQITINGNPGALLFVSKQSDANTVTVARAVRDELPELEKRLPEDVRIFNVMDSSEDIARMVQDLAETLLIGGGLAMLAVLIFLRQIRAAFIIGLAIPFSLILSAGAMYLLDYSVNMITLFAFIVVIGMVVDSAIVILENITRHRAEGESPREGAIYGATEVGMAITASTLTTLCVFFPLLFIRGMAQILFTPFAAVAGVILLAALFSALTLTPMLASRLLPRRFVPTDQRSGFFRVTEAGFDALGRAYSGLLGLALRFRAAVVLLAIGALGATFALIPDVGWEFMPQEDRALIRGTVELPVGTRLGVTAELMRRMDEILKQEIPAAERVAVFTRCGPSEGGGPWSQQATHIGNFGVKVVAPDQRDWTVFEMADRLRERIEALAGLYSIEDYSIDLQDPMSQMISGGEKALSVNILGEDMEATDRLAAELEEKIDRIPGTVDISVSREKGAPELWVNVDREKASSMGLNVSDVADVVRAGIYGQTASKYRVKGDEYDIFVRLRKEDRSTPEDLGRLPLRLPDGRLIRVENVADVTTERGPVEIERKDQVRLVRVGGDTRGRSLGEVVQDIEEIVKELDVPSGVDIAMGGQAEEMRESYFWLGIALRIRISLAGGDV